MRYSFHGKKRGTLEPVDGYIEATSAVDAIDQLADEGIIGVQSVRQVTPRKKKSIVLHGDFEEAVEEAAGTGSAPTSEIILNQLVAKVAMLVGDVERILSRPAALPAMPARIRVSETKQVSRFDEQQNSVLRDIFQSNLDLRRSVEKGATGGSAAPAGVIATASHAQSAIAGELAVPASSAA
jgi:hypothetical protein